MASQQRGPMGFNPPPPGPKPGPYSWLGPQGGTQFNASGGVAGAALSAPALQGTQIPSSGPAPMAAPSAISGGLPPAVGPAGPPAPGSAMNPGAAANRGPAVPGPLPVPPAGEPGPLPTPGVPPPAPPGSMTGGPLTPNPKPPGGYTGVNPYTQKPAQYGRIMPGAGGAGPLRPPGFQNT
jgi:hypothetical protein